MRLAINIEYDGTAYYGWQRQQFLPTVQEQVEIALSEIAAEKISIVCAGRTDTGVHAFGQVAHFDTNANRSLDAWLRGGNAILPQDIRIMQVREVTSDFHARYSARARHYRYVIYNSDVAPALLRHRTMWHKYPLDELSMQKAIPYLLGEHDFSSFRGAGCQSKSTIRNISSLDVIRQGGIINIDIAANAFLLHMVRNIVGILIKIGSGAQSPIWAQEVLLARDRKKAAITAPAHGLYLVKVVY